LLVWANPGQSGRFENPDNWLVNGQPMDEWSRPRSLVDQLEQLVHLLLRQAIRLQFLGDLDLRDFGTRIRVRKAALVKPGTQSLNLDECRLDRGLLPLLEKNLLILLEGLGG
jgi:hypothetical protein